MNRVEHAEQLAPDPIQIVPGKLCLKCGPPASDGPGGGGVFHAVKLGSLPRRVKADFEGLDDRVPAVVQGQAGEPMNSMEKSAILFLPVSTRRPYAGCEFAGRLRPGISSLGDEPSK